MPINVIGRLSTDAGNVLQAGSDGGLYSSSGVYRGPASAYVIDNSWAAAGSGTQYWYSSQANQFGVYNNATFAISSGLIWPVAFARDCTIGTSVIRTYTTTSAASTMYLAMYPSSTTTGLPGSKLVDLLSWSIPTTVSTVNSTQLNTSPTFRAGLLYWACAWFTAGVPNLYCQYGTPASIRTTGTQGISSLAGSAPYVAYVDSTSANFQGATGPTTLSTIVDTPTLSTQSMSTQYLPRIFWGLTNV